ncbi:MAG TPA: TIGR01777 family oxidoreductase [Vicinamibacterales bacterium]|jgi:uncharacterized protein (TIGR01777 family)|nr:TIGR01777 family oxidoreductase [Vicinamibacterales bacterium]
MNVRIVIAGGTGFLGKALAGALAGQGADVVVLTRRETPGTSPYRLVTWTPDGSAGEWASAIDGADAVVNLAGVSIAGARWTAAHKQRVLDSRVNATRSLVAAIRLVKTPPRALLNGSAIGYYGPRDDRPVTESDPPGSDFLASVCVAWEREAAAAAGLTRLVALRTGLVLEKDGGGLPEMLLPFRIGAGGPVGSGRQYWPWIHRDDWVAIVLWLLRTPAIAGPVNLSAPNPVTNREFARALGAAMHRPSFMPAPAFALRILLGEMAEGLLLSGQRAIPRKALDGGFSFRYTRVDEALMAIFR